MIWSWHFCWWITLKCSLLISKMPQPESLQHISRRSCLNCIENDKFLFLIEILEYMINPVFSLYIGDRSILLLTSKVLLIKSFVATKNLLFHNLCCDETKCQLLTMYSFGFFTVCLIFRKSFNTCFVFHFPFKALSLARHLKFDIFLTLVRAKSVVNLFEQKCFFDHSKCK